MMGASQFNRATMPISSATVQARDRSASVTLVEAIAAARYSAR